MDVWFKQFESHGKLILVEKTDSDDEVGVKFRFKIEEAGVDAGPTFNSGTEADYEKRDKFFEKVDQKITDEFVGKMLEIMGAE